ncbi:MAG TPA: hypothetical protein VF148_03735 [Acidimicrobiia bacterium]
MPSGNAIAAYGWNGDLDWLANLVSAQRRGHPRASGQTAHTLIEEDEMEHDRPALNGNMR